MGEEKPELSNDEMAIIRQFLSKTPTGNEREADIRKALVMKLEKIINFKGE